jgi:hypothetical protein
MSEIRALDVLALWKSGGKLRTSVCWIITGACVITMLIALIGPYALYEQGARVRGVSRFWLCNGLAIMSGVWITLTALFGWRLSRFVRVAMLLPILHLALMLVAWRTWTLVTSKINPVEGLSLVDRTSIEVLLVGFSATCLGGGLIVARRRRREWIHATAMIALSFVFLLGLWLPIAAQWWCGPGNEFEWHPVGLLRAVPVKLIALVLLPPMIASLTFAAFALRRPAVLLQHRKRLIVVLAFGLGCAAMLRFGASVETCLVYANFVPYVLVAGLVAIASLIVLGGASWSRPLRKAAHTGVIAFDDPETPVVAYFQITSWLRGPQAVMRAFTVRTLDGDIPVPSGATLSIPLPDLTTQLAAGESIEVLRCGDRVVLDGFVAPDLDHPFRGSLALIPGDRGISVGKPESEAGGFENVALAIWRPCVAYLLIITAIGIPALAAIMTT